MSAPTASGTNGASLPSAGDGVVRGTELRPTELVTQGRERSGVMGAGASKTREVVDEFRSVVLARGGILDALLPSAVFLLMRAVAGNQPAMLAALLTGACILLYRILRRQPWLTAVLGLGGSVLALVIALSYQRAELFFLPDVITNGTLAAVCLLSAAVRRPLVAWTSHLVRRWPREWYWHPRVLPAYLETTMAWAVFFLMQAALQWSLVLRQDVALTAASSLLNGWPATAVLLVLTYLYGTWRLRRLAGPSVAELRNGSPPPWSGQQRGF